MTAPFDRIMRDPQVADAFATLTEGMSGTDLTSFLLEVMRRRAGDRSPADVLRSYEENRFVAPSAIDAGAMRRAEERALGAITPEFEPVLLAPAVPFGTHAALGSVDQNNVVSAVRAVEIAADPTTGLALEAAVRRRALLADDPRSDRVIRLCGVQRVVRAQRFEGPISFPHFTILGLVTSGRDTGSRRFERAALRSHVDAHLAALTACGAHGVRVEFSDLGGGIGDALEDAEVVPRSSGYYRTAAFKVYATFDEEVELGDGGFVDWTSRLLGNGRERMLISGLGVDRIALGNG